MIEVKEWLKKAEHDLLAAEINFQEKLFDVSAFLSHQSAEKALKAFYIKKFKRLWKVHDLVSLAKSLKAPHSIILLCDALNPHYIETRYPLDVEYSENIAESSLNNAKLVIEWVKSKIQNNSKK